MRNTAFPRFHSLGALLLVVATLAAEPVSSASASRFPLETAVRKALVQSPAVRVREAEVDLREGRREQASGEFDWNTAAAVSANRERTPGVDALGRDAVAVSNATNYSASATRKGREGVIVQPSLAVSVPEHERPYSPTYGGSNLSLQIVVPLLRGLGRDSTGAAEAAARGDVEVARLLYRHALALQSYNTVRAYWSARAAQAALVLRRDDEQRAQKLHDGIRVLVDTRVFAPNLLLQSEANLRQKATSRQNAELSALDAGFELGRIIGLKPEELLQAPVPDQDLPRDVRVGDALADPAARTRWIERAMRKRADFLATRQSEVPLRILSRQAELDLRPRVDLSVRGGYAGLNSGSNPIAPLGNRLTGANGEVAVAFAWPVQNTYQRGLLRERRAAQRQAELTTAQAQSDVAADVCGALAEVRLRAETMANAAATAAIARKAVEQEQRRLQSGEATVLDVINLENLLSSAGLSLIDAQAGYAVAVARLRFSIGEIFSAEDAERGFALADLTQLPADEK